MSNGIARLMEFRDHCIVSGRRNIVDILDNAIAEYNARERVQINRVQRLEDFRRDIQFHHPVIYKKTQRKLRIRRAENG